MSDSLGSWGSLCLVIGSYWDGRGLSGALRALSVALWITRLDSGHWIFKGFQGTQLHIVPGSARSVSLQAQSLFISGLRGSSPGVVLNG